MNTDPRRDRSLAASTVILVCPCCASPVDAVTAGHEQDMECVACGQQWHMIVDADRVAEHALT